MRSVFVIGRSALVVGQTSTAMFSRHRQKSESKIRFGEEVFMPGSSFRDLRVWQEAMKLTSAIYKQTAAFPKDETYGLRQQIRRAAVSVPSNIAEGKGHHSDREFVHFLLHARGSLLELQTQLLIAMDLEYLSKGDGASLLFAAEKIGRSLCGLINSMNQKTA